MRPTIMHMLCLILAALISQANADSITRLSHAENRILSSLGHHMDQVAMNVFHNDFPHDRQRREVYDKFKETVQHTQSISERQNVFLRKVEPKQKLALSHPHDIRVFSLKRKEYRRKQKFSGDSLYMAIAENYHGNKNFSSRVSIHKFNEKTSKFELKRTIKEYAPHRMEFFSIKNTYNYPKHFLAVGGKDDSKPQKHFFGAWGKAHSMTHLSIYALTNHVIPDYMRVFQMQMSVSAVKYVYVNGEHLLVAAEKISVFTSFLTILLFDAKSGNFKTKTRHPVSDVRDIEAVVLDKVTYLVVAVYEDYFGKLNTKSLVFRYNSLHRAFEVHTKFDTMGALDIEVFASSGIPYLIVSNDAVSRNGKKVNNTQSYVYKIGPNFAVKPVATMLTYGAKQSSTIHLPGSHHKKLILNIDSRNSVDQVGTKFFDMTKGIISDVPVSFFHGVSSRFRPQPNRIASFTIGNDVIVVLANENENATNIFSVKYSVENVSGPSEKLFAYVKKEIEIINKEIAKIEKFLVRSKEILNNAVYTNGTQRIFGRKVFETVLTIETVNVSNLVLQNGSILYQKNGLITRVNPDKFDSSINVTKLEIKCENQREEIQIARAKMNNLCFVDVPENVTGKKFFKSVVLKTTAVADNLVNVKFINNLNYSSLINDIVMQGTNDIIHGSKFLPSVTIGQNLQTQRRINGINISCDLVMLSGDQVILASKTINSKVGFNKSVNINGKVNSVDIGDESVSLDENVRIAGPKTFADDVRFGECYVGFIDVSKIAEFVMRKDKNQTVTGRKVFKDSVVARSNVAVSGKVNKIDISELASSVYRFDISKKSVSVMKFLDSVYIAGNFTISGKLNKLRFPEDIVLVSKPQNITAMKTFAREVTVIGNVKVNGLLGGMNTSDFVTLTGEQTITGRKEFFNGWNLLENVVLMNDRRINGVRIKKMSDSIMRRFGAQNITGTFEFKDLVILVQEPRLNGKIDDVTLNYYKKLFANSVLTHGSQIITGHKHFKYNIHVTGNLTVIGYINNHTIPRDFLMLSSDQNLTGRYRFGSDVIFGDNATVLGLISNVDLSKLKKDMIDVDSDQIVGGRKYFDDVDALSNISCNKVNGINVSELMNKRSTQTVTAPKYFVAVVVDGILTVRDNVSVETIVNGVDLSELKRQIVYKNRVAVLPSMNFIGNVTIKCFPNSVINGVNISELANDAVMLDTNQIIRSIKQFDYVIINGNLITNSTIDGISVSESRKDIVMTSDNATINGNKIFRTIYVLEHLNVSGLIQGVNLTELTHSIVLKTENAKLLGCYNITGDVIFYKDISSDKLNGFKTEDFVLKNKKQNISGVKIFVKDLFVRGDLKINGTVNGIDVSALKEEAVLKNVDQAIGGKKMFYKKMEVNGDVDVDGTVDGVDLKELYRSLIRIDRYQEINNSAVLAGQVNFSKSLNIQGMTNNYDFNSIFNDAVTITGNQHITAKKIFSANLKVKHNLSIAGNTTLSGLLNGVNITLLNMTVMDNRSNQTITGLKRFTKQVTFEKDLKIGGLIGGVNLTDFVTINGTDSIFGIKTFRNGVKLIGNAPALSLVDGEDLSTLRKDTLFLNAAGIQNITGHKTFQIGPTFHNNVHVSGLIDGVNLSDVLNITLHYDGEINNTLIFQNIHTNSSIIANNSQFSRNLQSLWNNRLTLTTHQTIVGDINVLNNVLVMKPALLNGTVNGVDLPKLAQKINDTVRKFQARRTAIKRRQDSNCKGLEYVETSVRAAPLRIDFFKHHQNLPNKQSRHLHDFTVLNRHFLASAVYSVGGSYCIDSFIYMWNAKEKKFMEHQRLQTSGARKFLFFEESGNFFLAVVNMQHSCGIEGPSMIFKLNLKNFKFIKYQSISSNKATDIALYRRRSTTYLVIANSYDGKKQTDQATIVTWKMNAANSTWRNNAVNSSWNATHPYFTVRQKIAVKDATALTSFDVNGKSMVAVAINRDPKTGIQDINSVIYSTKSRFLSLEQKIFTNGANDFTTFSFRGHEYIVVAENRPTVSPWLSASRSQFTVYIYSPSTSQFQFYQSIAVTNALHVEVFKIKKQLLMSVVESYKGFHLYELIWGLGFEEKLYVEHHGLVSTTYLEIGNEPFLALASMTQKNSTNWSVQSAILKMVQSGVRTDHLAAKMDNC